MSSSQVPGTPPAGWYLDPSTPDQQRYWDGTAWTDNVAPQYRFGPPPPAAPPVAPLPVAATATGPGGVPYASFWRRLSGLVIDNLIFMPLIVIVAIIGFGPTVQQWVDCFDRYGSMSSSMSQDAFAACIERSTSFDALIWLTLVVALLQVAYFTVCLAVWGRTLGGLVVGIRCVTADGANPTWVKAFVRSVIPFGFSLLGLIPLLGLLAGIAQLISYLAMLWSPKRQTWMDRAAGTFVIKP